MFTFKHVNTDSAKINGNSNQTERTLCYKYFSVIERGN